MGVACFVPPGTRSGLGRSPDRPILTTPTHPTMANPRTQPERKDTEQNIPGTKRPV